MAASNKMITLKSFDGKMIKVPEEVAMESKTIRCMMKDESFKEYIPIPMVFSGILSMVLEYCEKHVAACAMKLSDAELKTWDEQFVDVDHTILYNLILAAYHLQVDGLVKLTCQAVANRIVGKSPEEIRRFFDIKVKEEEDSSAGRGTLRR